MDTRENHYRARKNWLGKPKAGWIKEKGKEVAIKFVKFEKRDEEDFQGPEEIDEIGLMGGINANGGINMAGTPVISQYFGRLKKHLGDYRAATFYNYTGGYCRPYIDFGISLIHQKYYYVIG